MSAVETKPKLGSQNGHVCPHQHVAWLDNFIRPLIHNPAKLFSPYVKPGMTALDIGCGGGFASMGLARLVGDAGCVIAADLQPEMLAKVKERAMFEGLMHRIKLHQCKSDQVGVKQALDFVLTFYMAHEAPDEEKLFQEIHQQLKPGGHYYLVEPKIHVSKKNFSRVMLFIKEIGFEVVEKPKVWFSQAAVLKKL